MAVDLLNYSNILIELNKAVKMHNFYPEGHPQLDAAREKCFLTVKKRLEDQSEITMKVDLKGFFDNRIPIAPGNQDIAGLAKKLYFRKIKELTFNRSLKLSDLKVLLSVIRLEPEEIQAKGGLEAIFAKGDVSGILFNEVRYEDLQKLKKKLEYKEHEEKQFIEQPKKEVKPPTEGEASDTKEEEEQEPPADEETKDEDLHALAARLRKETDFLRYNDLTVRINERSEVLLAEKNFDGVFPIMMTYFEHMSATSPQSADIKEMATERLKAYLTRDMLEYLVERIGKKEEHARLAIQRIMRLGGEQAVEILLDSIIAAREAVSRRHYYNAIVSLGPSIRPNVEARLRRPEWYAIRQMVAILGEFGDPECLDALEEAYSHPEVRIKKEVLKSLVKIKSTRVVALLLKALEEENESLVNQAIISLGVIKDPSTVDAIGKIALKWEPFADKQDSKKEAIKALGIIGDARGVQYLSNVLFRKAWFGKKANEEVRSLAAYSLSMIGGAEAFGAIDKACRDATGELYQACKRILEAREKQI